MICRRERGEKVTSKTDTHYLMHEDRGGGRGGEPRKTCAAALRGIYDNRIFRVALSRVRSSYWRASCPKGIAVRTWYLMCIAAGEARHKLLQPEFPSPSPLARLHAPFPFCSSVSLLPSPDRLPYHSALYGYVHPESIGRARIYPG